MRSPVRGYLRRRLIPLAFGIALVLFVTVSSVPAHKAGAAIPPTDAQHMAAATAAITPTRKVRLPLLQSSYGFHLQTPNPRNIGITLAGSRAASATVPPPGGTLAATAADGTRFTLTLPADALLLTTTITMTPISGVTNLPQGVRFVAGVHLEPEGLRLYQLATLVITPTVAVPITREVPFASSALGQDVYMYPLDHKTRPVTFWLAHFSEFSLGDGGPIPVKPDLDSIPLLPEEQYMQELQTLVQNQRQAELLGVEGDPDYLKKMIALLRGYYKVAILQKLPLAEKDCREAEQIVPKALAWAGQTQRLSGSEIFSREHAAIWDSWVRAFQNCWEKATKPCVNRNIPEQWHRVLTLGRQAALLELDPELYDPWAVPQCPCSRITAVQAWRGTITYSYSKSASGGGQKVELHQEANVTSQLARTSPTYPSFIGSVSGAAQIDRSWYLHGNLVSTTAGGPIVPYDPAANMGSRMNLVLYQNTCTYWFGVSVHVNASTCGSSGCSSVTALAGVVNSAYDRVHPISDYNLTLSGSGYMAAHADPYPHPREDVYFPMDSTLEWIASEGNLGNAWVTWSFTPMDVPPGP